MKLNIIKLLSLLMIGLLVVSGCNPTNSNNSKENDNELRIGILTSQTGVGSIWGVSEQQAAILRIKELQNSGVNIKYFVEDCGSNVKRCYGGAQKLINVDQVDVIVGPTWDDMFAALAPLAEQSKVLMISPSGIAREDYGQYTFSLEFKHKDVAVAALKFLKEKDVKKVALVITLSEFYEGVGDQIEQNAAKYGIEISKTQKVSVDGRDFRTVIEKLDLDDVDAVIGDVIETQVIDFTKELKEKGFKKLIVSTANVEEMYDPNSSIFRDTYFTDYSIDPKFRVYYESKIDKEKFPIYPTAQNAYDIVSIINLAFKNVGSDPLKMANYISSKQNFTETTRDVDLDENGYVNWGEGVVIVVKAGGG